MQQQGSGLEEDVWRNVSLAETVRTMMEVIVLLAPTVREALMAADPYGGVAMTNTKP
jgi:hypothetical protein